MLDDIRENLSTTGQTITLIAGVFLALVVIGLVVRQFVTSKTKDRWVDRIATVLVLAWTSEGMWDLATHKMHLPTTFVIASFFVVESMMVASAMRANAHRARYGVPGKAGRVVWALAGTFGFIVAIGTADAAAAFLLRMALPLAATLLWWTGLTAVRDADTPEMLAERARITAEREATWTVTPRTLLVRAGLMKPGNVTVTEAQAETQVRRMVALRMRMYAGGRWAGRRQTRLARLAQTATADQIAAVQQRVQRCVDVITLTAARAEVPLRAEAEVPPETTPEGRSELPGAFRPELPPGTSPRNFPPELPAMAGPELPPGTSGDGWTGTSARNFRRKPSAGTGRNHGRKPLARRSADETRKLVAEIRAQLPEITQTALASHLGISTRQLRNILNADAPDEERQQTPERVNGHQLATTN